MIEKKLRAESLLTSNISEELASVKIDALGLPNKMLDKLKSFEVYNLNTGKTQLFKNIGDLMKMGRNGLMVQLGQRNIRYSEADEIIVTIENKLAKIGLKFEDSDFTVLDVKISELEVSGKAHELLTRLPNHIRNLLDLSIQNKAKLRHKVVENGQGIVSEIERAMEKYGMRFVESSFKLDKNNFFPTEWIFRKNASIVNEERKKDINNVQVRLSENKFAKKDINAIDKKCVSELRAIGLSDKNIVYLVNKIGVNSVDDLKNKTYNELCFALNQNISAIGKIRKYLRNQGIELNRVYIRKRKQEIVEFDIENMSEEEKQKFKDSSVDVLGLPASATKKLKDEYGILKIDDLQKISREQLDTFKYNLRSHDQLKKTIRRLFPYKSDICLIMRKKDKEKFVKYNLENIHKFDKNEVLNAPLCAFGVTLHTQKFLKNRMGIEKLSDFTGKTYTDIAMALNNNLNQAALISKMLKAIDLPLARSKKIDDNENLDDFVFESSNGEQVENNGNDFVRKNCKKSRKEFDADEMI